MADNIMGGYGSSDITANIEVNLNNIDRSTQDAATMASQLKDWGSSIEAASKQLQDFSGVQEEMLGEAEQLAESYERIVRAARELKELSTSTNVNLSDSARNFREIQSAAAGLSGSGAGYTPGVSSTAPASVIDGGGIPGLGMLGAPEPTDADYGMPVGSGGFGGGGGGLLGGLINTSLAGRRGGRGGGGGSTTPASVKEGVYDVGSYGESVAQKMLGINYWMPGGKAAALGRYVDRLSGGGVTKYLGGVIKKYPSIFGTTTQELTKSGSNAFTQSMIDQGIGPMTAEQAGMLPAEYAAGVMPEIGTAASAAAEAGGLGEIAAGGLLGSMGTVLSVAAPVAALGYLGMQGYNAYATYQQQGQLLGSLTGDNNAGRMVGMEATDWLGTLFNPRLSYGTAKEIQMTGLAAGFQGNPNGVFGGSAANQGLLGQYTGFASGAYQNYGMSAQDSLSMFNASVIAAGSTVQQLSTALTGLAQVSSTTNTSFQKLQANFTSSVSTLGGLGFTGSAAVNIATGMSLANAGNSTADKYLQQQDIGGSGSLLETMPGIALTAQAAGMSFTQAFGAMGTAAGANKLATATNTAVLNILKNSYGLYPGMPNLQQAVTTNLFQIYTILSTLMPLGPDGKGAQWTPKAANDWAMQALSNGGTGESIASAQAQSVITTINSLTGGKSGSAGTANAVNAIASQLGGSASMVRNGSYAEVDINGNWEALNYINSLSSSQQQQVLSAMLQGKDKVRLGNSTPFSTQGSATTLGTLFGNQTLQGINNGSVTQGQMQIELGPKAAALFVLINNPQQLTNQQIKYLSSMGLKTNTSQGSGYIPF